MSTTTQTQSFTLATAVNLGSEWTMAEIRTLEVLKAGNMSIKDMAKQLGRSYYSISTKLIDLGLARQNRNVTKPEVAKPVVCPTCFTTISNNGTCGCDIR